MPDLDPVHLGQVEVAGAAIQQLADEGVVTELALDAGLAVVGQHLKRHAEVGTSPSLNLRYMLLAAHWRISGCAGRAACRMWL